MFTWICPQCGAEVPPSYDECPKCADKAKAAAPAAAATTAAAPPLPPPPPPVQAAPQPAPPAFQAPPPPVYSQPVAAPPQQYPYAMPVKQGPPAWLVTLGVAAGFVLAGYGLYSFLGSRSAVAPASEVRSEQKSEAKNEEKAAPFEKPVAGKAEKKADSKPSPSAPLSNDQLAKHLEAVGIRFTEENRRTVVTMAIVNHSGAEMTDLRGKVRIVTKDGEKSVSTVDFRMATIGPYEVRDYSIPLLTTMRAYELPDWQFLKAEIELR